MAAEWASRFRAILASPDDAGQLRAQAARLFLLAMRSAKLADRFAEIQHWYDLGLQSQDERAQRRNYAMTIALITTYDPAIDSAGEPTILDLDINPFYRGYRLTAPETILKHFGALVLRLCLTLLYSIPLWDDVAVEKLKELISLQGLITFGVLIGLWVLSLITGLSVVVSALLTLYGLYTVWEDVKRVLPDLRAVWDGARDATSDAELERAGQLLAPLLIGGVITALEVLLTAKAFRFARAVVSRVKIPGRVRQAHERALGALEERRSARQRASAAAEVAVGGLRAAGAAQVRKDLAGLSPGVVAAGAVGVVGAVGLAVYLSSKGES